MKLNVYRCEVCEKEHRRADRIDFRISKNEGVQKCFSDLCSKCEAAIISLLNKLEAEVEL